MTEPMLHELLLFLTHLLCVSAGKILHTMSVQIQDESLTSCDEPRELCVFGEGAVWLGWDDACDRSVVERAHERQSLKKTLLGTKKKKNQGNDASKRYR